MQQIFRILNQLDQKYFKPIFKYKKLLKTIPIEDESVSQGSSQTKLNSKKPAPRTKSIAARSNSTASKKSITSTTKPEQSLASQLSSARKAKKAKKQPTLFEIPDI